ncbi:tannase and feruloyl esterase [Penicillium angulare]|uniref:Carboxylic ester hydrolase n=1 Tax=Penicillium angulare TaxID=116970 RepID=A0A9W9KK12_9EURO|nr:tannase and feruloyl esterase [Penicillium angulare]
MYSRSNLRNSAPRYTGWPVDPINLPELCAIAVMVPGKNSNASFGFGMFLPTEWNGRTLTVGNGGLAGGVNWVDMGTGVKYGHAVFSTDTGHNSSTTDATWAYQNIQSQTNWGWKALHETVVHGKSITESYYQTKPSYNYYQGCSTGGRQGFKEAEIFPYDFDGVIAGAPAWWTDIISDPYGCNFDPEPLLCTIITSQSNSTTCLTAEQLKTFDTLTRDYVGVNSTLIFPSWLLGSEHFWSLNIDGGAPNVIGLGYIQYMLGLGPDWNWRDFNEEIAHLSEKLNPGQADASDYDLVPFFSRGKKIIHYHGLSDGGIATGASFYLHDEIHRTVAPQGLNVHDSYRSSRSRAWVSVSGYEDSKHDVMFAIMDWVENGTAPDYIIGTAWANFTTLDQVTRQRPICSYPQQAKYQGLGDPDIASAWECKLIY